MINIDEFLTFGILPVLALALVFALYRFIKGPTVPDRIIALELLITISIGIIVVYSIVTHQSTLLDIAMVFALIAFLGTLSFTFYLKQKNMQRNE
nr:cation:proton antiporter [Saprospiraceae bacterium]